MSISKKNKTTSSKTTLIKNGAELQAPSNAGASERIILGYVCSSIEALTKYVTLRDNRLPTMEKCLGNSNILTSKEAMELLEKVKDNRLTEWSCVYNLEDFSVSICMDGDYTKVYTYNVKELR